MKTLILAVGKLRTPACATLAEEYTARAARYGAIEVREVKAGNGQSPGEVAGREGARLLKAIDSSDFVVGCDERGDLLNSGQLAELIGRRRSDGRSGRMVFVVGGAEGLSPDLRERCDLLLSMSRMTLPHELARVILAEQIYRAMSILSGHPYHREGAAE
jgi:23S rRNA (pseudouridine1915-N3)-methyltransferase